MRASGVDGESLRPLHLVEEVLGQFLLMGCLSKGRPDAPDLPSIRCHLKEVSAVIEFARAPHIFA